MKDLETNIAGMTSIDEDLDVGNGVSVASARTILAESRKALEEYNASLAASDEKLNVFNEKNRLARAFNKKVKPAIGLKYGTNSSEYEKAGGVRESERKKPAKKSVEKAKTK